MTPEQRQQKIESYGNAYATLVAALAEFPREIWQFRPAKGEWSIHELIVHLADSEASSFVRCRVFVAEPGKTVMAYDENQWARALKYHEQCTDDALELFRSLRRSSYMLIKSLPESAWSNTIEHPENGTMNFEDWLNTYDRHVPEHVAQMRGNHEAWKKQC